MEKEYELKLSIKFNADNFERAKEAIMNKILNELEYSLVDDDLIEPDYDVTIFD